MTVRRRSGLWQPAGLDQGTPPACGDRPPDRPCVLLWALLAAVMLAAPSAACAHTAQDAGVRAPLPMVLAGSAHPWHLQLMWTFDLMDTAAGGRARGWKAPGVIDLRLTRHQHLRSGLDSRWHIDLIRILGSNPSRDAGDAQVLDNLAAHHAWRLYRAFWQLGDPRRHWALRLGWQGYDESFGLVPAGSNLINSSFGQMPTGSEAGMPIWPQTAPGISARWHPGALYLQAGLWSGTPRDPGLPQDWNLPRRGDGGLQALELGLDRIGRYKLAVGAWALHRPGAAGQAHRGTYALADARLFEGARGSRLSGFLQWGRTRPGSSAVGRYRGAGLRWTPTASAHGRLSLGIARAALSAAFRAGHPAAAATETAYEVTWRQRINTHLSVQPDLQYIAHPALAPTRDYALVIGVRVDGRF